MITKAQLIEQIEGLDLGDSELMDYILVDESKSEAFNIAFKANPEKVLNPSTVDEGILGFLNKRSRKKDKGDIIKKLRKDLRVFEL